MWGDKENKKEQRYRIWVCKEAGKWDDPAKGCT